MRFSLLLIIASLLAGCIKSGWIHDRKSTGIFGESEDGVEADAYEFDKEDIAMAKQSQFPDFAKLNDNDWPLMVALAKESRGVGTINCRDVNDPFKCILAASEQRKPAYSYLTRMGTDSVYGWGIASRADGSLIIFGYDSSPCGQVSPNGGCGFSLSYGVCEVKAELIKKKFRRQKAVCLKPLISFE